MSQTISDVLVEHLVNAGVQRIYGLVGDSLEELLVGTSPSAREAADQEICT